uniref:Uncharacterized protein n=1 Tax=Oryza nivara TaxID=4536 RepID=A0A0E0FK39_ORYNI
MDRVSPPEDGDGRPITMEGQAVAARGLVTAPGGLGAPADALVVAADGHNANTSAVAAARTLLPNAPLPAMEFNLPVLQVQIKLAMLLGEGTSSQTDTTSPVRIPTAAASKKMTPKRKLHIVQFWGICSWQLQQVQERLAAYQPSQASQCSSHGQAAAGQPSQSQAAASQPDDRLAAWEHAN